MSKELKSFVKSEKNAAGFEMIGSSLCSRETEEREQKAKLWAWSTWMHTWMWANFTWWETLAQSSPKGENLVLFIILCSGIKHNRIPKIPIITHSNVDDILLFSANFSCYKNMEINKSQTNPRPKLLRVNKTYINICMYNINSLSWWILSNLNMDVNSHSSKK